MDFMDYYKVLGVMKIVLVDEIKKVYCKFVKQYYLDKNKGDKDVEEKFKVINEVNEVFGDFEK